MEPLALVIGVGVIAFLLFYFAFNLDNEHFILKYLVIFLAIGLLFLVPKVIIDYPSSCDLVVSSEVAEQVTFNATHTNTTTTYTYSTQCGTEKNTARTLLNAILWFYRLFAIYIFIYLFYYAYSSRRKNG